MDKICNLCGCGLNNGDEFFTHKTDDGKEYYLCKECEENGVEIHEKKKFYICGVCGFPHCEEQYAGICNFCENNSDFEELYLTSVEEELLDNNPRKLYEQKFGEEKAKKIAEWTQCPEHGENDLRLKRDRHIDTVFFAGIVISYILLELSIRLFVSDWVKFFALLVPTILVLISSPVFKFFDKKEKSKNVSIWILPVIIAILVDIYTLIAKFF